MLHACRPSHSRYVVEVAARVGDVEVDRRWHPLPFEGQRANGRLERPACAERMSVEALGPTHRNPVRVVAEHLLDRRSFAGVVERRRAAVRIHITDLAGRHVCVGEREAHGAGGLRAVGQRRGHVMRVVGRPVTAELGVHGRPSRARAFPLLQHEHHRALSHHESIAIAVERPRRASRLVVARAHCPDQGKGPEAERGQRGLGAAGEHHVGVSVADLPHRLADRHRSARAAHGVGGVGSAHPELNGDVAARRAAEHGKRQRGVHRLDALRQKLAELFLGVADATERRAHHRADALAVLRLEAEFRIGKCQSCRGDGKLPEPVEAFGPLGFQMLVGPKVVHLRRVVRAEYRRVEAGERPHGRTLRANTVPERFASGADRRDCPDAGDGDAP